MKEEGSVRTKCFDGSGYRERSRGSFIVCENQNKIAPQPKKTNSAVYKVQLLLETSKSTLKILGKLSTLHANRTRVALFLDNFGLVLQLRAVYAGP